MLTACRLVGVQTCPYTYIMLPVRRRAASARRNVGPRPVLTLSERHGVQGRAGQGDSSGGSGATRSLLFAGEHGEHLPFDAPEHRGT